MPFDSMHVTYSNGHLIANKYRLLRGLGEGGMAAVWLARDEQLQRLVALKIMPLGDLDPLKEARIGAALAHASIVRVLDSGSTDFGHPFLAMEYLEGHTLREVLRRDGHLCERAAVELLMPVLECLEHCHERGVTHRDVKPDNIFLVRSGNRTRVKLLDFGVAEWVGAVSPLPQLTGTPGYMAPEQAAAAFELDPRADLWSFCAVLYETVAGRPLIEADGLQALLARNQAPRLQTLVAAGSDGESTLWPILERGLQHRPQRRYRSATELKEALRRWLERPAPNTPTQCGRQPPPCSTGEGRPSAATAPAWKRSRPVTAAVAQGQDPGS
jgi:serine/threonine protein kinase